MARRDGQMARRVVAYLPEDLGKALAVHCAEESLDMSEAMAAAVQLYLSQRQA